MLIVSDKCRKKRHCREHLAGRHRSLRFGVFAITNLGALLTISPPDDSAKLELRATRLKRDEGETSAPEWGVGQAEHRGA